MSNTKRYNPKTHQKETESNHFREKKEKRSRMTPELYEFIKEWDCVIEERYVDKHWLEKYDE